MKFRVTMKDPDTLGDAVHDAVDSEVASMADLSQDEKESVAEKRSDEIYKACAKWFEYGEYLTVEIDTDAKTCVVVERNT